MMSSIYGFFILVILSCGDEVKNTRDQKPLKKSDNFLQPIAPYEPQNDPGYVEIDEIEITSEEDSNLLITAANPQLNRIKTLPILKQRELSP